MRINNRLEGFQGAIVELGEMTAVHYHYADWDAAWRKQMRYAINYSIALDYKPQEIDLLFAYTTQRMDETGLQVKPVKPEWGVLD
jgi:hypothetical protein